jgi:hypothetical protein
VSELLAAQRVKAAEQAKSDAASVSVVDVDETKTTAHSTATDVPSGSISKPVSKEDAIAQFKKAVSDAQNETKKVR